MSRPASGGNAVLNLGVLAVVVAVLCLLPMMTTPYYVRVATGVALWAGIALVLERDLRLRRLHQLRSCRFLRHRRVHHGDPDAARSRLELLGDASGRRRGRRRRCRAGRLARAAAEGRVLRHRDLGAGRGDTRAHHSPRLHRRLSRAHHADPPRTTTSSSTRCSAPRRSHTPCAICCWNGPGSVSR